MLLWLTYTLQISPTNCKFYKIVAQWLQLDSNPQPLRVIVAQVYDVSYPKIALFHMFWLKGHEKLSSATELECVSSIKLQAWGLWQYLNKTQAQLLSCEFCLILQKTCLQNSCERLFLLFFLKFYFLLCEQWQGNEDQQFSNHVNINQFKKSTPNFHVMCRDIYFQEKQQFLVFCSAKYSSSCIVFIVFSA